MRSIPVDYTANNESPKIMVQTEDGKDYLKLTGQWNLRNLAKANELKDGLHRYAKDNKLIWDITGITVLDNAASLILWLAWNKQIPDNLRIKPEHRRLLEQWPTQPAPEKEPSKSLNQHLINFFNQLWYGFALQVFDTVILTGQLVLDIFHLIRHPGEIPWQEMSTTVYEAGVRALGITALVGFLIGIVLSYLSALQLKMFGAEIYIIDILGLSIIRELGPLLAAILVAGRSGSAISAQIGIMRVTEELDALSAMGISHSMRLILPKVLALTIILPLLTVWTNAAALVGGMFSAQNTLDISYQQFFLKLPDTVPLVNVFIGLGKSATFGFMIALIACHFGFRIKPNTESLGSETTNSVVAAITVVIMVDALYAILFMDVGMP